MPTVLSEITRLSTEAQELAFPGVSANVQIQVGTRDGVDYQNNSAMQLFGLMKKSGGLPSGANSPKDVATKLSESMRACDKAGIMATAEVSGAGFINIALSVSWLAARVQSLVVDGILPPTVEKRKVVIDYSSPNVAKEMHIGHIRSTIIGDALARVLEFCGHEVERVNHVGDWGTQFGMLIGHLKRVFPDFATKPPPISDLQQFYRDAKKVFDEDEEFKHLAHQEVVRLQAGDAASLGAWEQICEVSRREFEKIYARLGVSSELHEVGESFYNPFIPPVVAHLDEIGQVKHDSSGAKLIFPKNTKQENPLILVKSDGGYNYDSTDMAAVWYRLLEKKCDWVLYVVDARQGSHFELIFAAAEESGWTQPSTRLEHVGFGTINGSDGKPFKTRSGDVVRLADLLDTAQNNMLEGTVDEETGEMVHMGMRVRQAEEEEKAKAAGRPFVPMSEEEIVRSATIVGIGAVKYADLKNNRNSNYIFSYARLLDPNGNTAVYLLYAGARIKAIQRKAEAEVGVTMTSILAGGGSVQLKEIAEVELSRELMRFTEVIENTLSTLLPSALCDYLYNLCKAFTKFYLECKVIGTPEQDSRLLLCFATEKVLRKGYDLIGIGYLERI